MPRRQVQPVGRTNWDEDLYSSSTAQPEDVFYAGSDDEYYESPEERERRLIAAAQRFLQHGKPYIMTSNLNGPFEATSGWSNPWCPKRRKQSTSKVKRGCRTPVDAPSSVQQRTVGNKKAKLTHLPTPESLSGTHNVCSEPLSSNSRIRSWQNGVVPPDTAALSLSASPSISQSQLGKRKSEPDAALWERRKRSKPLKEAPEQIYTPTTATPVRPQSSQRAMGSFHQTGRTNRSDDTDSDDELTVTSPSPFPSQNSNHVRTLNLSAKRSPVNEFFTSRPSDSEDELGASVSKNQNPNVLSTPSVSQTSTPVKTNERHLSSPQSDGSSGLGSEDTSAANDSSIVETNASQNRARDSGVAYTTTPKTPTRVYSHDPEDNKNSEEESMSAISDSRMRALSVEFHGHSEMNSPSRSARPRADTKNTAPSITVDTTSDAALAGENSDTLFESDTEMGSDADPKTIVVRSAADESERQSTPSQRRPLAALDTNQCNKPVQSPKTTDSPLEMDVDHFPKPSTPRAAIRKTSVKTPEAKKLTFQEDTREQPYIPTFASFMSPSPQRVRTQRPWARKRPQKNVSWAPLPDGKDDLNNTGSDSTPSLDDTPTVCSTGVSEPPRRMSSPPPDSETLDSALQEGASLGRLLRTLHQKGSIRSGAATTVVEPLEAAPAPLIVDEVQEPCNDKEIPEPESQELGPTAAAPSASNEDAWLDMIMDNVGTELATYAWDETGMDQANGEVAFDGHA